MRALVLVFLAATAPAWGQSETEYKRLLRGYVDTFRLLGRAKACRLDFDAAPYLREVARRHGESSEALRLARASFAAGAEEGPEIDQAPPAPMPCDVVALAREIRLPDLPPSHVRRQD